MSVPPDCLSRRRRRRREGDDGEGEDDQQTAQAVQLQSNDRAVNGTDGQREADSSAADAQPPPQSAGVQPLPEQSRRGPLPGCSLHSLATVELQLCLQLLDSKSKLKAARCSRRLLQAASAPFAWRAATPVAVEPRSAADVQRIATSLLRFTPVHLRCIGMESLLSAATVPHLAGLWLLCSPVPVTDLPQLLQHPNLTRLQTIRLDSHASRPLTVDTMRLVARLPQLRALDLFVPGGEEGAALLQPLTDAPALTDLAVTFIDWAVDDIALMDAVGRCAGLRRLTLGNLKFRSGTLISLCSSPNMRPVQHLELVGCIATAHWDDDDVPPGAEEYADSFSALEQLQSLTLEIVFGINKLLPHLHRAPALRLLSIRCQPDFSSDVGLPTSMLPSVAVLSALLASVPQLDVRLVMPATLGRWMAFGRSAGAMCEHQWRELQRMAAEMERVIIVDVHAQSL